MLWKTTQKVQPGTQRLTVQTEYQHMGADTRSFSKVAHNNFRIIYPTKYENFSS